MKESIIGILIVHAVILVLQFGFLKLFPNLRWAIPGVYFVLLPVGFLFFLPPDPWVVAVLVMGGLLYILFQAQRAAGKAAATDAKS